MFSMNAVLVCFLIYLAGTMFAYPRLVDKSAIIGMVIISCIPVLNLIVATVIAIGVLKLVIRDIHRAFKNDVGC